MTMECEDDEVGELAPIIEIRPTKPRLDPINGCSCCVIIGSGARTYAKEDFDIVIGTEETVLRFVRNGEVFLNDRSLGKDEEIFEALRCFLRPYLKEYLR
jgi:hypothetical protein